MIISIPLLYLSLRDSTPRKNIIISIKRLLFLFQFYTFFFHPRDTRENDRAYSSARPISLLSLSSSFIIIVICAAQRTCTKVKDRNEQFRIYIFFIVPYDYSVRFINESPFLVLHPGNKTGNGCLISGSKRH